RSSHTATLLPNGTVLIAGGALGLSAELYDPSTGTFTATGNMIIPNRFSLSATLLPNGKVLIAGGASCPASPGPCTPLASAELYAPATGMFTPTGSMTSAQRASSATLLPNGKVFVAADGDHAELYDPGTGTFARTGSYADTNSSWDAATLLLDGRVLLT